MLWTFVKQSGGNSAGDGGTGRSRTCGTGQPSVPAHHEPAQLQPPTALKPYVTGAGAYRCILFRMIAQPELRWGRVGAVRKERNTAAEPVLRARLTRLERRSYAMPQDGIVEGRAGIEPATIRCAADMLSKVTSRPCHPALGPGFPFRRAQGFEPASGGDGMPLVTPNGSESIK